MATTSPTRIDDDLFASAKAVGEVMSRSASQQVSHWARIGRELEAASSVSLHAIAEVLAGGGSYDRLTTEGQAVVRAGWSERLDSRIASLDLAQSFAAGGRSFVEVDDDGNVVRVAAPGDHAPSAG
jgi:hypothetical protein